MQRDRSGQMSTVSKLLIMFTIGFFVNIGLQLVEFTRHTTCDTPAPAGAPQQGVAQTAVDCPPCPKQPALPSTFKTGKPASCPPCPACPASAPKAVSLAQSAAARVNPRAVSDNPHIARATTNAFLAEKLERWIEMSESISKGDNKYPAKFVHCSPKNQMGNRVRFVVPCLLFALLTDRALIVDFEGGFQASMADLFDLPLALDERSTPHQPNGQRRYIDFPSDNEVFTCQDPREALTEEVVAFGGAYYFVPHLLYNPHLRAEVERLFPDGKVAEPLTLFAMWPRPEVWAIVRKARERFMPNASFIVGVQIRNNVPPDRNDWITPLELQMMNDCAVEVTPPMYRSGSKWFCAGDAPRAITMCQENLDQKHAVSRWQPSEFVLSSGPAELREAVADIMLMATSDELIINPWSSYGQMAAVYHRKPAYWVSDFKQPEGHDYGQTKEIIKGCFKLTTTEYSVREWSEWSPQFSCFHKGMLGDHWL